MIRTLKRDRECIDGVTGSLIKDLKPPQPLPAWLLDPSPLPVRSFKSNWESPLEVGQALDGNRQRPNHLFRRGT